MSKNKTYKVTLEFDNESAAHGFFAYWIDGGGDGGGNMDYHTDDWDNEHHTYMRIRGSGEVTQRSYKEHTPERQIKHLKKWLKSLESWIDDQRFIKEILKDAKKHTKEKK